MLDRVLEPRIMSHLFEKANAQHIPLSGAFEISPLCNMDCRMCYVKMSKEEMQRKGRLLTMEEWLSLAEEAKKLGLLYILLTGGEPFLRRDFKELYLRLGSMGFVLSINSNGTMIGEREVNWLKEAPPMRLNITLYGASNETYARLCRNAKGFDQVTRAVTMLKEAGISVKLNASMTPYNIDDMEKMYQFAEEHNVQIKMTSYMFPPLRRDKNAVGKNDRFTAEEAGYYMAVFDSHMYEEEHFLIRAEQMRSGELQEPCEETALEEGECMMCRAGRSTFWVTWDGKMPICGMMNEPAAYPFKQGFAEAWDQIGKATEAIRLPRACAGCKSAGACINCAAMSYTETGEVSRRPEYLCRMTEAYIAETLKLADVMLDRRKGQNE